MLFRGTRLIPLFTGALGLMVACSGKSRDGQPDDPSGGSSGAERYELKIFHAERKQRTSSLTITLPAFDPARSQCLPSP